LLQPKKELNIEAFLSVVTTSKQDKGKFERGRGRKSFFLNKLQPEGFNFKLFLNVSPLGPSFIHVDSQ
jgi:hypothetical protein